MRVWRINLKPAEQEGVSAREHCLNNGLVGIGWQIDHGGEAVTMESYCETADEDYAEDSSIWPAWNALVKRAETGDLIWTRDVVGQYYLGRITGNWYYDISEKASAADIVNVRPCQWFKVGTAENVPGKLINCFIPGRTIQQVWDETVAQFSMLKFNELAGQTVYKIEPWKDGDIFSLLSSEDCEDILLLYMQFKEGYVLIPSSRTFTTMAYEYELIHRDTKQRAIAQVKNGYVNLSIDDYSGVSEKVYLFTTKGDYLGEPLENVTCIDPSEMIEFMQENQSVMTKRIQTWMKSLY